MAKHVNILDHAPQGLINALARVLAPLEDPTGTARPRWASSSRYQLTQSFDEQALNGVFCNTFRCIVGNYYTDTHFHQNWGESDGKLPHRAGYGVIKPSHTVASQWYRWKQEQPQIDVIPRVIDLELSDNQDPSTIAVKTWQLSELIADHDGVRPMIYSRRNLIRDWLVPYWSTEQIEAHWYYLAQYLWDRTREHPGPPDVVPGLPIGRVILQQTADKKPALEDETGSGTITWERWDLIEEGEFDEMVAFVYREWGGQKPPDTLEERVMFLEAITMQEHPEYWE